MLIQNWWFVHIIEKKKGRKGIKKHHWNYSYWIGSTYFIYNKCFESKQIKFKRYYRFSDDFKEIEFIQFTLIHIIIRSEIWQWCPSIGIYSISTCIRKCKVIHNFPNWGLVFYTLFYTPFVCGRNVHLSELNLFIKNFTPILLLLFLVGAFLVLSVSY